MAYVASIHADLDSL